MSWELTVNAIPPSGNKLKRMHWARYSQLMRDWYGLIRVSPAFVFIPKAVGKRWVGITRVSARELDRDNLWASVKPVVDVLRPAKFEQGVYKSGKCKGETWIRQRIGHGLILDDCAKLLELNVQQRKPQAGENKEFTIIEIEDLYF